MLYLHCTFAVPSLHLCTFIAPLLYLHCTFAVPSLHLCCTFIAPLLYLHCTFAVPSLHLCCTFIALLLYLHCTFAVPSLHLCCTFSSSSLLFTFCVFGKLHKHFVSICLQTPPCWPFKTHTQVASCRPAAAYGGSTFSHGWTLR